MLDFSRRDDLDEQPELGRLEELQDYAIAGTPPEPRFDAIARAAGTLFKAPMAFLTLIEEDRQWYKSAIGYDIQQTERSVAFCNHTIMEDDVMVISDASIDPRFSGNPAVTGEPKIRFYAGAPLITEKGFRLGALCVADTVPRSFSCEQRAALSELAALAMSQISARRSEFSMVALAGLAQSGGQPLIAVDRHGLIEFVNHPAGAFLDYMPAELKGMPMDKLISAGKLGMDARGLIEIFESAKAGAVSHPFRRAAIRRDGSEVPVEISVSRWDAASGSGIAIVLRDSTEKAVNELNAVRAGNAGEDNDFVLSRLLERLIGEGKHPGLFLVALDGFDAICGNLGRKAGQAVLRSVSVRLQRLFPQAVIVARARSDDFAIVFEDVTDPEDGHLIAQSLLRSFEDVVDLGPRLLQTTASVGFALGSAQGDSVAELIANAGFALGDVRRGGGRGAKVYDEGLRLRSSERQQLQLELTQALKNNEFRLFYQPQVSLADGRIFGVEALIRWQHPTRGLLQPQDFLLDIEECGLSLPVGWWTLETACAQLAAWRRDRMPEIRMGVNLFASQFRSERLVPYIVNLLDRYEISPGLLELEVTETIALLGNGEGLASCQALRNLGVHIAFDDFGTGYASLSSLQRFPLSTLKIDRSFVRNIVTNTNDTVITRSMIAMASDLDLATIAEGIETPEQEAVLRLLGCKSGQGYLYSKPIPADAMGDMLAREAQDCAGEYTIIHVLGL